MVPRSSMRNENKIFAGRFFRFLRENLRLDWMRESVGEDETNNIDREEFLRMFI